MTERARISLVDLTAPLQRSAREGAIPWFWGDTHWNAIGHVVAAQAIAEAEPLKSWIVKKQGAHSQ